MMKHWADRPKPVRKITHWEIVGDHEPYVSPELRKIRLSGIVDGRKVTTSSIVHADNFRVETRNTVYVLEGLPSSRYIEWMEANGIEYNVDNPVRIFF